MAEAATAIRARDGFADVRVVPANHVPYSETSDLTPLRGDLPPLTDEQAARQAEIEDTIAAIEASDDDLNEEAENRLAALEAELGSITDRMPILTDAQRQNAVAYVVIGADGQPRVHEQLYVAARDDNAPAPDCEGEEAAPVESEQAPGKPAISQRLADELAMMKTELLSVHVASDPSFALDLGTFIMVEAATRTMGTWDIPSDLRANAPTPRVSGFESGTPAASEWIRLEAGLDRSWTEHDTIETRYDAFCALADDRRASWLGWVVARTLHAVPAGRTSSGLLDHVGRKLAIDVAAWWRPTARTYFDRVTKPQILSLFDEVGGAELRQRYGASKKHDLAASAERLFAGDIVVEADVRAKALAWLPDEMRFEPTPDVEPEQAQHIEPYEKIGAIELADEPGDAAPIAEAA